jgi:hypothetical protein
MMLANSRMLKVLLVQYSLSGETSHATEEFLKGLSNEYKDQVTLVKQFIEPTPAFGFPWSFWDFFDVLPETIHPSPWQRSVVPPTTSQEQEEDYDLVVLGWQTWYLSPSLPVRLALEDPHYQSLLNDHCQQVVLLGTHRNMWHHASDGLCASLQKHCPKLKLAGQINFCQSSPFLVSVVETLQRQLQGNTGVGGTTAKQDAYEEGRRFARHCQQQEQSSQAMTVYQGGTPWNPTLAFCENTFFPIKSAAAKLMTNFAPGSVGRKLIMVVYIPVLLSAIVFLAPPILLVANVKNRLLVVAEDKQE